VRACVTGRLLCVQTPDREFRLTCSFVEIYNEVVRDLLEDGCPKIGIRVDRVRGAFAECKEVHVTTAEEMMELLHTGERSRVVGKTDMNERSSRSHTIFTVTVKSSSLTDTADAVAGSVLMGKLNIVDLAGSESVRTTGAQGDRLKEAGKINTSLLTLARVIESLGSARKKEEHVSFRDSKLTHILQPSLAGGHATSRGGVSHVLLSFCC
jgi:centromeric protein E